MPKHSISGVPRYFVPHVADCFQNAYGSVVSYMKLNPDLILADYLSFMFDSENGYIGINFLHKPSKSFLFTKDELNTSLEYACFPAVTCFGERIPENVFELSSDKIKISIYIEDDSQIAHERLKELIHCNIPVVVVVDLYHMRYHRAYQREHGAHAVIVTGYNEEEGYVELFDKYSLSNSDFDGKIPINEFKLARSSENFLGSFSKPIRHLWMEISKNPSFYYNDLRWKNIIEESCKRMLGEKDVLGFRCGLQVIDSFRRELLLKKQELPEDEVFPMYRYYYNPAFKILSRSRTRFGVFLRQLNLRLPSNFVEEVVFHLEDSARRWEVISNMSLRLAITKNLSSIDNLCKQLEEIRNSEGLATEKLLQCVKAWH